MDVQLTWKTMLVALTVFLVCHAASADDDVLPPPLPHGVIQVPVEGRIDCRAINMWKSRPELDVWCTETCNNGLCPTFACECEGARTGNGCTAINQWEGFEHVDKWCEKSCSAGFCPETACKCPGCRAINSWEGIPEVDIWCTESCTKGFCPDSACYCD